MIAINFSLFVCFTRCYIDEVLLFVREFQKSNNVIVYYKQSEDSVISLGNMEIMFKLIIVSWPNWEVVAAAIFNVLLREQFNLLWCKDWALLETFDVQNLQINHNYINEDWSIAFTYNDFYFISKEIAVAYSRDMYLKGIAE